MSAYDQLMARFKRPNKTSLTRQEAVAPTPGQAASNLSAPPLRNGTAPAATIPASSVRAGRMAVDVNKAKDPDRVKENMELINGGASNTTDETTAGVGSVKPTSHSVEVHDAQAPKVDSYDRMLEFLQANQVADADADARARRREMFASIGDGISAISSLYQTTKGAPVTYTPGADMTKVMRDRYDRMIAQRKADSDKYLNYLKVQAAKETAERRERLDEQSAKHQAAQEKYWESQGKRWEDYAEHQRRQDEEKERADKEKERLAAEKEVNRTKEAENKRKDNNANKAKDRQSRERIAAKAEAGRQSRYNQTRADKQAKDKQGGKKSPTSGSGNKTRKESPTARKK